MLWFSSERNMRGCCTIQRLWRSSCSLFCTQETRVGYRATQLWSGSHRIASQGREGIVTYLHMYSMYVCMLCYVMLCMYALYV